MNKEQLEKLRAFITELGFTPKKVEQSVLQTFDEFKEPSKPVGKILITYFTVIHYEP